MSMPLFIPFLVLTSLALQACSPAPSNTTTAPTDPKRLSACPRQEGAPLQQASYAECGQLSLPINPQNPAAGQLQVQVLRLKAVNPAPAPDPLLVIAGGPGQSALRVAESLAPVFEDVRKHRDILFIDQRGTGQSAPLDCALPESALEGLGEEAQLALLKTALPPCADTYKALIPFLTTPYAVQDLDAVRAALGYRQVNLWGGSYGSRVVLEYIHQYPNQVRTAILDGLAPAPIALPSHMAEDAQAAFHQIAQQCQQQPACHHSLGDIQQKAHALSTQLQQAPLQVRFAHPRTRQPTQITLTQTDLAFLVRMSLYSRELSSLIPMAIAQAMAGQPDVLASLVFLSKEKSGELDLNLGLHFSVVCSEDRPLAQLDNARTFLQVSMVNTYRDICAFWPKAPLNEHLATPVHTDVPSLFLSGAADPVTPPRWAQWAMQGFSQAQHLIAPGGHHLITREGCVPQLIAQFIRQGQLQGLDTRCVQTIQPLPLQVPKGLAAANASSAADTASTPPSSAAAEPRHD